MRSWTHLQSKYLEKLSSISLFWVLLFLGRRNYYDNPRVPKSWKSSNLWFSGRSGSQITVSKPRSAAPTRNLRITCRGEDATSVSNTPPGHFPPRHAADFTSKVGRFFNNFFKSASSFPKSFEFPPRHTFKRGTCQISARLKHSGYHFSWGDEIIMRTLGCQNHQNHEICDFQAAVALKSRF